SLYLLSVPTPSSTPPLSLHDALPICMSGRGCSADGADDLAGRGHVPQIPADGRLGGLEFDGQPRNAPRTGFEQALNRFATSLCAGTDRHESPFIRPRLYFGMYSARMPSTNGA